MPHARPALLARRLLSVALAYLLLAGSVPAAVAAQDGSKKRESRARGAKTQERPKQEKSDGGKGGGVAAPQGINTWTTNGPDNLASVNSLVIEGDTPATLYAATEAGVYKSADAGATWTQFTAAANNLPVITYNSLAIDPTNNAGAPATVFAAGAPTGTSKSLFRSTDGGQTWALSVTGMPAGAGSVSVVTIDPTAPATVFAGLPNNGIYKSTNGGNNWAASTTGITTGTTLQGFSDIVVDPLSPLIVYAGVRSSNNNVRGLWKSTNGGANWSRIGTTTFVTGTTAFTPVGIYADPLNAGFVYAATTGATAELYRSTDGGGSWSPSGTGLTDKNVIDVARDSAGKLYCLTYTGLFTSADNGANWSPVSEAGLNGNHFSLALHPSDPNTAYVGAEYVGVFKTTNAGASWAWSSDGFQSAADFYYSLVVDPSNSNTLYAGGDGAGLFKSTDGGLTWQPKNNNLTASFGLVISVGVDPTNSNNLLVGTGGDRLYRSTDGGESWSPAGAGLTGFDNEDIIFDPANPQIVYVTDSGTGVRKSTDGGLNFTASNTGIETHQVFDIDFDPTDSTVLFAAVANGGATRDGIYKSADAGATWTRFAGITAGQRMLSIAIDPTDPRVIYVVGDQAYKTADGGGSWSLLNTGSPDGFQSVAVDPSNRMRVYAGTDNGEVYQSADGGQTWGVLGTGLPAGEEIWEMAVSPSGHKLYVTAGGNGVYEYQIVTSGTFIVNSTLDAADSDTGDGLCNDGAGNCTLRAAIQQANATAGADSIQFDIPGAGPHTISLAAALPGVTEAATIDGYTEPGASPNVLPVGNNAALMIQIDGQPLTIAANGVTLRGLSFTNSGISLIGASNTTIEGNFVGLTPAGADGNGQGIEITGGSNNLVGTTGAAGRNVISGSNQSGIILTTTTGNLISNNYVGTNPAGTAALANANVGILIAESSNNTVGGASAAARNVVSGNGGANIRVGGGASAATGNVIRGNYVGTNAAGSAALGGPTGIQLLNNAPNTVIGGTAAGAGNVISGHASNGIDAASTGHVIQGNLIGTDAGGTAAVPNGLDGIYAENNIQIGGAAAGAGNTIAFNAGAGVAILGGSGVLVSGNSIHSNGALGIDIDLDGVTANDPAPDADAGSNNSQNFPVLATAMSAGNSTTVTGALTSAPGTQYAVEFFSSASCDPSGNGEGRTFLGSQSVTTDGAGSATINATLPRASFMGEAVTATATDPANNTSEFSACVTVGSPDLVVTSTADSGAGSLRQAILDANTTAGAQTIVFNIPGAGPHTIQPASALPAITQPVTIDGYTQPGSSANTLPVGNNAVLKIVINGASAGAATNGLHVTGGTSTLRGLVIQGFTQAGVRLENNSGNTVEGCFIGTDPTGVQDRGNATDGVIIVSSSNNLIGGAAVGSRNVISGNNSDGIEINGGNLAGNVITNNYVGVMASGQFALPNTNGVNIGGTPNINNTRVGGTLAGERNVISGNNGNGILIASSNVNGVLVQGNYIGTNAAGDAAIPNIDGFFTNFGSNITIGGDDDDDGAADGVVNARNVISGNTSTGVDISTSDNNVKIQGNYLGTDAAGTADLGNAGDGISTGTGGGAYLIGGATAGAGNVISGNDGHGIIAVNTGNKVIQGNLIGTDRTGTLDLGNTVDGIRLTTNTNTIGGASAQERNVISGNNSDGIEISGGSGNVVRGNFIGTKADGTTALPNGANGINLSSTASNSQIGGTSAGQGNTVAFNTLDGITILSGTGHLIAGNSIHSNGTTNQHLGIDLDAPGNTLNGRNVNDAGDADVGANNLQNYPVVSLVEQQGANTRFVGALNSVASTAFDIDFYSNPTCDPVGSGEGKTYLATTSVTTDASGNAAFDFAMPLAVAPAAGEAVTATARTAAGNTSEFSLCHIVGQSPTAVSNTNDNGAGSLRDAILNANAIPGTQTISFAIPASDPNCNAATGVCTISPATAFPVITDPVIIDGLTQTGATANTQTLGNNAALKIELNGTNTPAGTSGLTITAGSSVVRGLVINRFKDRGIILQTGGGNTVHGNFIGSNPAGDAASFNANGGINLINSPNNQIGGTAPAQRNLIASQSGAISTPVSDTGGGNTIQGNYLGTNAAGTAPLGTGNGFISLANGNNLIGGTAAGAGNVIANNNQAGIVLTGGTADNNTVQGNYIGLSADGTAALGSPAAAISITNGENNLIGGATAAARNVILSGGGTLALNIAGSGGTAGAGTLAQNNRVQGNYFGTNAAGTARLPGGISTSTAITITDAQNTVVGGTNAGEGNLIAGFNFGIRLVSGNGVSVLTGTLVQGNLIGTNAAGTGALANSVGIQFNYQSSGVVPAAFNVVGGTTAAARNVISGNASDAVQLTGQANKVRIQGNYIGVAADGATPLGNLGDGVEITNGSNNEIGGLAAGEANLIANNGSDGVLISAGTNNRLRGNSIHSNGAAVGDLGIDLNPAGVTANDANDADAGANNLQNFPVLTSVSVAGGNTTVTGTLNSTPNTTFDLDFYSNATIDTSGNGEGQNFVGTTQVTTDASGNAAINVTFNGVAVPSNHTVTATATNPANNTSEFSAAFLAALVVTNANDSGAGSLRQAILEANTLAGTQTIAFNIGGGGAQTINLASPLPAITGPVVLDATTQPGFAGAPLIELNGAASGSNGLVLSGGDSTVRGFVINRFGGTGIVLQTAGNNVVTGNYIGTNAAGTAALANGNGISVGLNSPNNRVGGTTAAERNLISGNSVSGILLNAAGSGSAVIQGNYIGTDVTGASDLGNGSAGINVTSSNPGGHAIGGAAVGAGNLISGNNAGGLALDADNCVIQGNLIGTNAAGTAAVPNGSAGVTLNPSASGNLVGGNTPAARNVISGNTSHGIDIVGADGNSVRGNYVGTGADGTTALGNGNTGVSVSSTGDNNQIGGAAAGEGNLVAFNAQDGVRVNQGTGNAVRSNSIHSNGTTAQHLGIDFGIDGVTANDAGDGDTGANNLQNFPVVTSVSVTAGSTRIQGTFNSTASASFALDFFANPACDAAGFGEGRALVNTVNLTADAAGNAAFDFTLAGQDLTGQFVTATATNTTTGDTSEFSQCATPAAAPQTFTVTNTNDSGAGSLRQAIIDSNATAGAADTIAFNIAAAGVQTITPTSPLPAITDPVVIDGYTQPGSAANTLAAGTNAVLLVELSGTSAGAGASGLHVTAGSTTIRGLVINRFTADGIRLDGAGNNTVEGNFVGTNPAGATDLGNTQNGVHVISGANNSVGGIVPAARNLVSGNNAAGVATSGSNVTGNLIRGNLIGTNAAGTGAVANGSGVNITGTPNVSNNTVGGQTATPGQGAGNVISGNTNGVVVNGSAITGTLVLGNLIGLTADGATDLGNSGDGVQITNATGTTVGGTNTQDGNVISGNNSDGVQITSGPNTTIQNNLVGTGADGVTDRGNTAAGINATSSTGLVVGGAGAGNVISGQGNDGIQIGASSNGAVIKGNLIGTSVAGTAGVNNGGDGIQIASNGADIGGATAGERNVIGGNSGNGLNITGSSNVVRGNYVGTGADGTTDLACGTGISISGTGANNQIGGAAAGEGNLVAFCSADGVSVTGGTGNLISRNSIHSNGGGAGSIAIDLGPVDGTTANDAGDADSGPNNLQNFPVLTSVSSSGGNTTITGTLNSTPNTTFTVEFFSSQTATAAGEVEAQTFLRAVNVTTDAAGNAAINDTFALTLTPVAYVTATATDPAGNTSELSNGVALAATTLVVTNTNQSGAGSLPQAVIDSNLISGTQTITFNIPGAGVQTIQMPSNTGMTLTDPVVVDGYTQPGSSANTLAAGNDAVPLIDITGSTPSIFSVQTDNSTFRGLIVRNGGNSGISLVGNNNAVEGCFLGTNPGGTTASPFAASSLGISGSNNRVGGTAPAQRNLISGGNTGIGIIGAAATGNVIQGNFIGTTKAGTADLGNFTGISISNAPNNTVGGTTAAERNVISGNVIGVSVINAGSTGNVISGNFIGTTPDGTTALGNDLGVRLAQNSSNTTLGGTGAGAGNVIAFSTTGDGVEVSNTTGAAILGNSIHSNADIGIDLFPFGLTPNDAGDADTGANNLQNFPVLASATSAGGNTTVTGTLNSTPSTAFRVEFFSNASCDASGSGEGRTLLGFQNVTTDAAGNAAINSTLAAATATGAAVTATATDPAGNTSEFSPCVVVPAAAQTYTVTNTNDAGPGSLRQAIIDANASAPSTDTISFAIPGAGVHTIAPTSALPAITDSVIIDGTTQPGYAAGAPTVELSGASAGGGVHAFQITADTSVVRGLVINRFVGTSSVRITGNGNVVSECFIGTDPAGATALSNGVGVDIFNGDGNLVSANLVSGNVGTGIGVTGFGGNAATNNEVSNNRVGTNRDGTAALANGDDGIDLFDGATGTVVSNNLVSGNGSTGVVIRINVTNSTVRGNLIGTNAAGTAAVPNGNSGVRIQEGASNNDIGGSAAGQGNTISGNNGPAGVHVADAGTTANEVLGNRIGTRPDGTTALANAGHGVLFSDGASNNIVGASGAGEANTIAFNGGAGVAVTGATTRGNAVNPNSIHSNNGLGVDLESAGVNANDVNDTDAGGNNLQNFPVITSVTNSAGNTTITGTLNSHPNKTFRVEVYSSASCDASGNGEGQTHVGAQDITTVGNNGSFSVTVPQLPGGRFVTATAMFTGEPNAGATVLDTSEFSACFATPVTPQTYTVTNTNDAGAGSLRQAILDANANAGVLDTVAFNIANAGVKTIQPVTPLPAITDPVVIDGYTQPGASANTLAVGSDAVLLIELDGTLTPNGTADDGLRILAGGSTVRGLVINRFASYGISIENGDANTITGNWIGPFADGLTGTANSTFGVLISDSSDNLFGGPGPADRNVVASNTESFEIIGSGGPNASTNNVIRGNYFGVGKDGTTPLGNEFAFYTQGPNTVIGGENAGEGNVISNTASDAGIFVDTAGATGGVIRGNLIGLNVAGAAAGNADYGILANAANLTVGGATAGARNVISANASGGITFNRGNTVVRGNFIGTDLAGTAARPNTGHGVEVNDIGGSITSASIGGAAAGEANLIAFNTLDGVNVTATAAATGVAVLSNAIHSNGGLGVNLAGGTENAAGVTANDAGDADTGANNLQNFPVLTSATAAGGSTTVTGTLNSAASTAFRVEFFSNAACDPSGSGEGRTLLGSANVTTDAAGNAAISATVGATTVGESVTATATDPAGNTSELSACRSVTAAGAATDVSWTNAAGGNWHTAANWLDGTGVSRVPGPNDNALITLPGNYTVTMSSDARVSSLTLGDGAGTQALNTGTFTLTLANASTVAPGAIFHLNGSLSGAAPLEVLGTLNHNGAIGAGAGALTIRSGGTVNFGGTQPTLARALNVEGTANYNPSSSMVLNGVTINNQSGATFNVTAEKALLQQGAASVFNNAGTVRKLAGAGETEFRIPFNNTGTVDLQAGSINFSAGGASAGAFNGAAGTLLKFSSPNLQAASTVSAAAVEFTGGSGTVAGSYNVTGTTTAAGTTTFTGNVVGVGQTLNVTGSAVFNSNAVTAATVNITGNVSGSADLHTTLTGTINLSGALDGTGTTNVPQTATLNLQGTQPRLSRTLNNFGTANYAATSSMVFAGATFNNLAGSTFNVQTDTLLMQLGAASTFVNRGTVRKQTGAGAAEFRLNFDNSGTVDLQSGELNFSVSGASAGTFNAGVGTHLRLNAHDLQAGSAVNAFTLSLSGATTAAGTFNVSQTTNVTGGTSNFTGNVQSVGQTLNVAGTANFNSNNVTAAAVNVTGTLGGSANVSPTATGALDLNGGTLAGAGATDIAAGAVLQLRGTQPTINSRTVNNAGTANYAATSSMVMNGAAFNNLSGATFNVNSETLVFELGTPSTFTNQGSLRKQTGAGAAEFRLGFDNSGTVELQAGELNFSARGTSTGAFNGAAGTTLRLAGQTLQPAAVVTAQTLFLSGTTAFGGTLNVSGTTNVAGTATFTGNVQSLGQTLNVTGAAAFNSNNAAAQTVNVTGTLGGSADVSVPAGGTFNLTGGMLSAGGATTIPATATLNLGGMQPTLARTVNNAGTTNYAATSSMIFNGATFNNLAGATFNVQTDTLLLQSGGASAFNNAGGLNKATGAGTAEFRMAFANSGTVTAASGLLHFSVGNYTQTAGETVLSGGNIQTTGLLDIQGGLLRGAGTITGNVRNAGTLRPGLSPGCTVISGNYEQTAAATLDVEIGGATACTQYDRLQITGTATLAGTLAATLTNGFTPAAAEQFQVVTFASRTGTFSNVTGPLAAAHNASDVVLSVTPSSTLVVTNTNDSGAGSLRQAILDANAQAGAQTISFQIAAAGVQTITPASPLPAITDPVTIDGYTQPGSSANTVAAGSSNAVLLVELSGASLAAGSVGLKITAGSSVVRGLVVNRFGTGIELSAAGANTVEGNFIGTTPAGTVALGNGNGVLVTGGSDNNRVGTNGDGANDAAERNLISGNTQNGVLVRESGNNVVAGNLIGVAADGAGALGNGGVGVGFTTAGQPTDNNRVGTNGDGANDAAEANVIANNGGDGVAIDAGTGNRVSGNSVFANGHLGIDLFLSGVTPNDANDGDAGPNNLQNFPVLTSAVAAAGATQITGTFNSAPDGTFTVEYFSSPACDASGNGEGQTLLGSQSVLTDAAGNATLNFALPAALPLGQSVTATAADSSGNTSEFSACRAVTGPPPPTFTISGTVADAASNPVGGVLLTLTDGATTATTTTNSTGSYSFTNLTGGANYTVTPSLANFSFAPASRTYNNLAADQTAQNFTATANPGTVQFSAASYAAAESGGGIFVTLTRTGNTAGAATVNYADTAGTASAADYSGGTGSVAFAAGEATKNFTVNVTNDTLDEPDESFTLALSVGSGNVVVGAQNSATVTITDDDAAPSISVGDVTLNEGNSGQSNASFNINLSAASGQAVTVNFATADGTATAGSGDYAAQSGTATIPAGATTFAVNVAVSGDSSVEPDETFFLNLTSPANATITDAQGQATITNDDNVPVFQIGGRVATANNQPLPGVTVTLSGAQAAATQTDAAGNYSFASLPAGGNYTVTPSLAGFAFAPPSRDFANLQANQTAADFAATLAPVTISGRIVDENAQPVGGVTVNLVVPINDDSEQQLSTTQTDGRGNYSFAAPSGGNYLVRPSRAGMIFTPPVHIFRNASGNRTGDFVALDAFVIRGNLSDLVAPGAKGAAAVALADASGVVVTLSGTRSGTTLTDSQGSYTFTNLPLGGTYRVTPQNPFNLFDPPFIGFPNLGGDRQADFGAMVNPSPTPTPPIRDDFTSSTRDADKFSVGTLTQPAGATDPLVTVEQTGGKLVITPRTNFTGLSFNGYVTTRSVDFTNATADIRVDQIASGGAQTIFSVGKDDQNFFRFVAQEVEVSATAAAANKSNVSASNTLQQLLLQVRNAGIFNSLTIPYDPVAHRYWRFRHDASASPAPAMFFEASPTGAEGSWSVLRIVPVAGAIGSLAVEIGAGTAGAVASPGRAIFDDLNVVPAQTAVAVGAYRLTDAAMTVAESAGSFQLRVRRTGVLAGESFVDLASEPFDNRPCSTADGRARPRCDYSTTFARLRFAPNESEKIVTVFVTDDVYAEGDETFRLALGNASGGFSLDAPVVAITIRDDDQPGARNPINGADFFVRQQYLDFLNREPEPAGFAAWTNVLKQCAFEGHFGPGKSNSDPNCDRILVSSSFYRSTEFHTRGFFAYRFYEVSLGRRPTYDEFLSDMQRMSGAQTEAELEASKAAFVRDFMARGGFGGRESFRDMNGNLDTAARLDQLLARAGVTLANRDQLAADLAAGRMTPAQVLRAVAESNEVSSRYYNRAFVAMQYFGYLQRDPEPSGYQAWLNHLNANPNDFRTMIFGFIYSQEYQSRFGPVQ